MDNNATCNTGCAAATLPPAPVSRGKKTLRKVFPFLAQSAVLGGALAVCYVVDKAVMQGGFSFAAYGVYTAMLVALFAADWFIFRD